MIDPEVIPENMFSMLVLRRETSIIPRNFAQNINNNCDNAIENNILSIWNSYKNKFGNITIRLEHICKFIQCYHLSNQYQKRKMIDLIENLKNLKKVDVHRLSKATLKKFSIMKMNAIGAIKYLDFLHRKYSYSLHSENKYCPLNNKKI